MIHHNYVKEEVVRYVFAPCNSDELISIKWN